MYTYKEHLALNNLQWLICHKIEPNQTKQVNICTNLLFSVQKWHKATV